MTGIVNRPVRSHYDEQVVEHVATYAAERGDGDLEKLCDDVLAGHTDVELVFAAISDDDELAADVMYQPWRTREGGES